MTTAAPGKVRRVAALAVFLVYPRHIFFAIVLVLAILALLWLTPQRTGSATLSPAGAFSRASASSASTRDTKVSASPRPSPEPRSALADQLNSPATDIQADLHLLGDILDTFRSNFPQTGNPAGNNAEITAILTGKNPLKLSLIPRDHAAINRQGELCDRWGRPFFFHQLGATQTEIRSAGPDRKLWTDDDALFTP